MSLSLDDKHCFQKSNSPNIEFEESNISLSESKKKGKNEKKEIVKKNVIDPLDKKDKTNIQKKKSKKKALKEKKEAKKVEKKKNFNRFANKKSISRCLARSQNAVKIPNSNKNVNILREQQQQHRSLSRLSQTLSIPNDSSTIVRCQREIGSDRLKGRELLENFEFDERRRIFFLNRKELSTLVILEKIWQD